MHTQEQVLYITIRNDISRNGWIPFDSKIYTKTEMQTLSIDCSVTISVNGLLYVYYYVRVRRAWTMYGVWIRETESLLSSSFTRATISIGMRAITGRWSSRLGATLSPCRRDFIRTRRGIGFVFINFFFSP